MCKYEHRGVTLDDAEGAAFDKLGRLLGLPFPGGPAIEKAARDGNTQAFSFPRAVMGDGYNFSFSGLKTAVLREVQKFAPERLPVADLAASFQAAVVDVLVAKTNAAATAHHVSAVHLAGGVSANRGLRQAMKERLDMPVYYPSPILCTDNAAMIAAAGYQQFLRGDFAPLHLDVTPSLQLQ